MFTFKKYIIKLVIMNLIIITLFLGTFYFCFSIDSFLACIVILMGFILLFKMISYHFSMIRFLRSHSKKTIKEFEKELSNTLLRYSNCFLTDNYIFSLETFVYTKYDEIICLTPSVITTVSGSEGFTFGQKQILYLKNNKKYVIKTTLLKSPYNFVKLIKKKNPNIFIGNISEYKIEKENKEYLKNLKSRKKI